MFTSLWPASLQSAFVAFHVIDEKFGKDKSINFETYSKAVYKSGTGTRGRGHRDACVGTWDLETRDEGLEDIKYGTWGRVGRGSLFQAFRSSLSLLRTALHYLNAWNRLGTGTRGRQKQGHRGRGMWTIIAEVGGKRDISFFLKTLDSIFQNHIRHVSVKVEFRTTSRLISTIYILPLSYLRD